MADNRYAHNRYMIRKKIFKLLGQAFHVYDEAGNVLLYSKLKAFKLKEDIRVYTGEDMATEVLVIKARQIIDVWAAYDVMDAQTGEHVGALKRRGLKSVIQDEWTIMDGNDNEIGAVKEENIALALIRRSLTNLVPQSFEGTVNGVPVCTFKRHFNPFVLRMDMDFSVDTQGLLDRRLGIAAAILLSAIEGRQN
ncbi:MAG: hypothetical protein GY851_36615 [bacterium]|nr:hypothetical protein [bacterium]